MKRVKKSPSRRRRALRNVLLAVLVIVLTQSITLYSLTPMHAIEKGKERGGIFDATEVVTSQWVPELHRFHRLYMIGNENMVALSSAVLRPVGWAGSSVWAVDCAKDLPVHCGSVKMSSPKNDGKHISFYYGRIDDHNIDRVEIVKVVLDQTPIHPNDFYKYIYDRFVIPRSEWIKYDGHLFFLHKVTEDAKPDGIYDVHCYDKEDNLIYQARLDNRAGVSWS